MGIARKGGICLKQGKLVLCDPEADYAQQMAAFLARDKDFPWEITVFTCVEGLLYFLQKQDVAVLLMAESVSEVLLDGTKPLQSGWETGRLVLLNESGEVRFPNIRNIDKYQDAENIRRELLKIYAEGEEKIFPALQHTGEAELIGFYSPAGRCLQTGFSIAYGQQLAEKGRVLYLNFEMFASFPWLSAGEGDGELAALLYYLDGDEQKFQAHLRSMLHGQGNWKYIPSMRNAENVPAMKATDWLRLLDRCRQSGEFEYMVLDLNDSMQGLLNILGQCDLIYTIQREDAVGRYKQERYENLLEKKGRMELQNRTIKLVLPKISDLPCDPEDYTKGMLAEYAEEILARDFERLQGSVV